MKYVNIIIATLLIALFTSCNDSEAGKGVFAEVEDVPVSTYLANDAEGNYSLWVELLRYTDLYSTLNLKADYTCFVPVNQAMEKFLADGGYSSVRDIDIQLAKTLVKYHTVAGRQISYSEFEDGVIPDTTSTGDFLSIEIREGGLNNIYVNGEGRLIKLNIVVSNGIVHTLENVLTPITETVYGMVESDNSMSLFTKALIETGYNERLDQVEYTDENNNQRRYKYTLFAESDHVFASKGISTFEQLVSYLGADSDFKSESNELNRFVAYHILDQQYGYSELAAINSNKSAILNNELINFSDVDGTFYINYDSEALNGVMLDKYNKSCKNGMVHTLTDMMEIKLPPLTKVTWEFTDYSELASLYSGVYRLKSLSSSSSNWIAVNEINCYTWKSVPDSWKNSAVGYYVCAKSDATRSKAENYDFLQLYLGLSGWVEMQTPTILKGTYKVSVKYYSPQGTEPTGLLSFILDGDYLGSQIAINGASKTSVSYKTTQIATIEFAQTGSHTLRILAGDNAKTEIDCMEFTPVN